MGTLQNRCLIRSILACNALNWAGGNFYGQSMEDYPKRVLGALSSGVLLFLIGVMLTPGIWPFGLTYGFLTPFLGFGLLLGGILTIMYAEHLVIRDGKGGQNYSQTKAPHPFMKLEERLVEGYSRHATMGIGNLLSNKLNLERDLPGSTSADVRL
jgi:hypothetical protein